MGTILATLLPLYLIVALGFLAGRMPAFNGGETILSAFVYYFAFPAFLFTAVSEAPRDLTLPVSFYVIASVIPAGSAILSYLLLKNRVSDNVASQAGLTGGHGNVSYFGIPLCLAVLGPSAALPAAIAQLVHNLVFWVGFPLTRAGGQDGSRMKTLLKAGPLNPAVIGLMLGLVMGNGRVPAPALLSRTAELLGNAAIPAALASVGLAVAHRSTQTTWNSRSLLVMVAFVKNLWLPALTLLAVVFLFPDGVDVVGGTLILMAAMPTSVASYSLAQEHGGAAAGVAQAIMASTLGGLVTIPLFTLIVI